MCLVPNGEEETVDRENKRGQSDVPVCCVLCMCAQVNLSGPYRSVNPPSSSSLHHHAGRCLPTLLCQMRRSRCRVGASWFQEEDVE